MKVPMNGSLVYEAQVASVFIRNLPEKGALVLYLTKLPKKVEDQVARKKVEDQVARKKRRAGLQTAQRSLAPGWQTLAAASNNQTTPHTNLHFTFFQTLVNALLPFYLVQVTEMSKLKTPTSSISSLKISSSYIRWVSVSPHTTDATSRGLPVQ